jgi:hypothetical protein
MSQYHAKINFKCLNKLRIRINEHEIELKCSIYFYNISSVNIKRI